VAAMAAGRRLRTGGTGGGRCRDLHVQGQALVFEGKSLHMERRGEEASSEVVQRQHRILLSWVRDNAGRQISAIIPDCCASRTLGKNHLLAWYGRSSVAICRPQEHARDRGACQTFAGDAGKSLSGMAGVAPTTSAGVATRASQERRSQSRSNPASRRLWRSRQARAMSPSWTCSSPMRSQSLCPLIVRQVSSPAASSGCSLPGSLLPSRPRAGGPAAPSACSHLGLVLADSPARHGFCSLSIVELEKPRQDALGCG